MPVEASARKGGSMSGFRDGPYRRRYLGVLASAVLCYGALGVVLKDLPHYVKHQLGGSAVAIGLAVGAPSLTGALMRPLGGRVADRINPRSVLMSGAALMAVGAVPAFVQGIGALMLSRLLVGAGEAFMMSAAVLWLLRIAGPERRGVALGHIGLANYAGLTAGPLLAGALGTATATDRLWLAAMVLPLVCLAVAALLPGSPPASTERLAPPDASVVRLTFRPGLGLLLVNVGYVAVLSFGAAATDSHHLGIGWLIVPVFGLGVIASRTLLARIPDRWGGPRALAIAAAVEAVGLAMLGLVPDVFAALAGLVLLAVGQGLAVPSLGLLALGRVPPGMHGAAAGIFFAYFDGGVGLGGPAIGAVAGGLNAPVALAFAGAAVALAIPVSLWKAETSARLIRADASVPVAEDPGRPAASRSLRRGLTP